MGLFSPKKQNKDYTSLQLYNARFKGNDKKNRLENMNLSGIARWWYKLWKSDKAYLSNAELDSYRGMKEEARNSDITDLARKMKFLMEEETIRPGSNSGSKRDASVSDRMANESSMDFGGEEDLMAKAGTEELSDVFGKWENLDDEKQMAVKTFDIMGSAQGYSDEEMKKASRMSRVYERMFAMAEQINENDSGQEAQMNHAVDKADEFKQKIQLLNTRKRDLKSIGKKDAEMYVQLQNEGLDPFIVNRKSKENYRLANRVGKKSAMSEFLPDDLLGVAEVKTSETDYSFEVMVKEPSGSRDSGGLKERFGHTFVRMKKKNSKRYYSFGFSPIDDDVAEDVTTTGFVENPDPVSNYYSGSAKVVERKTVDVGHALNAVSFIRSIIASGRSFRQTGYNDSSFAIEVAKAAGITLRTSSGAGAVGEQNAEGMNLADSGDALLRWNKYNEKNTFAEEDKEKANSMEPEEYLEYQLEQSRLRTQNRKGFVYRYLFGENSMYGIKYGRFNMGKEWGLDSEKVLLADRVLLRLYKNLKKLPKEELTSQLIYEVFYGTYNGKHKDLFNLVSIANKRYEIQESTNLFKYTINDRLNEDRLEDIDESNA